MKKTVMREEMFCDFCPTEVSAYTECLGGCGKHACYSCLNSGRVIACRNEIFLAPGPLFYCNNCHYRLRKAGDSLLLAYEEVSNLRDEYEGWHSRFKPRMEMVNERLTKERDARGLAR